MSVEELKICSQINQSCKQILENPLFWLKKFRSLSLENQKHWREALKALKNSSKENAIISYFQWNLKKEVVDLPCYSSPHVQDDFRKTILEAGEDDIELVKILVPLTDNPNAPDETGATPIFLGSRFRKYRNC